MDLQTLRCEREGPLAWITLNRPAKLNAISKTMVAELNRAMDEARTLAREIARNDPLAVRLTKQALNRACEIPSMREALEHALQIDITIETTETDESRQFNEILRKEGAKAAIAWRDSRLG